MRTYNAFVGRQRARSPGWRKRLLSGACVLTLAVILVPGAPMSGAHAQFVCDSTTPGGADGATAAGGGVACGTDAVATANSTSVGFEAGENPDPGNLFNTAFGNQTGGTVEGDRNTAIGASSGTQVTGDQNTATGFATGQVVTGSRNTAVGIASGQAVQGDHNVAAGFNAGDMLVGDNNIAIGLQAGSGTIANPLNVSNTVTIGANSLATSDGAIAMGLNSSATGTNAIAIGQGAVATGSTAMGTASTAGNGGAAFGDFATATGADSTATGPNATATHANAAAFGNGATTTRASQQVFGTASNTYTTPGITSQASKQAQGSPTHLVTSNASGDLAAHTPAQLGLATAGDLNAINSRLDSVDGRIRRNSERIGENTEGVAIAMAMAGTFLPQPGETFRLSGNWGGFEGSNALSFGGALALSEKTYLTGGFGAGLSEGTYGGRAGLSIGW